MTKSSSNKPLLRLKKVTKTYHTAGVKLNAVDQISLDIYPQDFIAITGPSGSGKSTLMHIIGLLDNPTSGQITLNGQDVSHLKEHQLAQLRNQTLGFVFQTFNLLPRTSSLENVTLPLLYSDLKKNQHQTRARKMLDKVGLGDKLKNTPAQLSGGEQQRVAIARALVNNPKIVLADEPTGNLDSISGQQIMDLLKKLHQQDKRTILLVTHEARLARQTKKVVHLKDGKVNKISHHA